MIEMTDRQRREWANETAQRFQIGRLKFLSVYDPAVYLAIMSWQEPWLRQLAPLATNYHATIPYRFRARLEKGPYDDRSDG